MAKKGKGRSAKKGGSSSDTNGNQNRNSGSTQSSSSPNNKKKPKGKKQRGGKNHHKKSQWGTEEDIHFRRSLESDGRYAIMEMAADGNCLFRSLADQLFLDHGQKHGDVRSAVCDFIEEHEDEFSVFLVLDENEEDEDAADFESYVSTMRQDGEWGGNLELVAAARLYRRNITVFSANLSALNIGHGAKKSSGPDLLLSYHDNDHYSSVRDAKTTTKTNKSVDNNDDAGYSSDGPETKTAGSSNKKPWSPKKKVFPSDEDGGDSDAAVKLKKQSTAPPLPKKNDVCPCGSGKKYKRCCWAGERRTRKTNKGSEAAATATTTTTREQDDKAAADETCEMNGHFRVLQI